MKLICPYCFREIKIKNIEYKCVHCPPEDDPKLAKFLGVASVMSKRVIKTKSGFFTKSKDIHCDNKSCGARSTVKVCPECHNELPANFGDSKSHIISVFGGRASGKSHYITVLTNEIRNRGYHLGLSLHPVDLGDNRNYYTSNMGSVLYETLYEKHQLLEQTQQKQRYPFIYELRSSIDKKSKSDITFLVFYDDAGENMTSQDALLTSRYVLNSSGMIFLLDSDEIHSGYDNIEDIQRKNKNMGNATFRKAFDTLKNTFEKFNKVNKYNKIDIPIAITFSKFDDLVTRDLITNNNSILNEEGQYITKGHYDAKEMKEINNEIVALLEYFSLEQFIWDVSNTFMTSSYFGMSSLGKSAPTGDSRTLSGDPLPKRVLDPLLWILDQLKFSLKKKK